MHLSPVNSNAWGRVELLVTFWTPEMLCTLVLHERVFVCKIPVAIPGWSRGGENVVQDGRGRSGVACGKVAGNSYSWRWTKGKYTFVYMKNNEDKSTDRQKQSSRGKAR